jgi:hypothetical protein
VVPTAVDFEIVAGGSEPLRALCCLPVGRRHQQREPGRLRGNPLFDHLGKVISTEGLIRDDQYPTHRAHLSR